MRVLLGFSLVGAVSLLTSTLPAEWGWFYQNPTPQSNYLYGVSFADADNGIAVGEGGTILRTTNGGTDWSIVASGTGNRLQAVDQFDADTIVAVGDWGIWRSINCGATWTRVLESVSGTFSSLSIVDENTGFALTFEGLIYRTDDAGANWTPTPIGIPATAFMAIAFADADKGVAVGFNDDAQTDVIVRTIDGGGTWTDQSTGVWRDLKDVHLFDADNGLAIGFGRLLRTTDGGATWTEVVSSVLGTSDGDPNNDVPFEAIEFLDGNTGYIIGGVGGFYRTSDGGATWVDQSWPDDLDGGLSFMEAIAIIDADTAVSVGRAGDIVATEDGGTSWMRRNENLLTPYSDLQNLSFLDANTGLMVDGGILRTTDGGATWTRLDAGLGIFETLTDIAYITAEIATAVGIDFDTSSNMILRTTDGGATWTRQTSGANVLVLTAVDFRDADNGTVVGEGGTIVQTSNGGTTWVSRTSGTTKWLEGVDFADADKGVAVGREGTLLRTTDGGATWVSVPLGSGFDRDLNDVTFTGLNTVTVVGSGTILQSTDGGETWSTRLSDPDLILNGVSFLDANTGIAVGGGQFVPGGGLPSAILRTTDGGVTWVRETSHYVGRLADVHLIDANHAIAIGSEATILRTTTGGEIPVDAPTISASPMAATVETTGSTTLSVEAVGENLKYQWKLNGVDVAGATGPDYEIPSAQRYHAGDYTVTVSNNGGSISSASATLTVEPPPASEARLMNLSTRAQSLTGNNRLIPGFVIAGTGSKNLLVRAVGATLRKDPFNIPTALEDPQMTLKRWTGSAFEDVAVNDDWETNSNAADIAQATMDLGAFALTDGKDAALYAGLEAGRYTVVAGGVGDLTGVAIVELFDADSEAAASELVNISNRGFVGTGASIMIPGVVVSAEGPKTFLMRAVGPALGEPPFNLTGVLENPRMSVFSGQTRILFNDDWGDNPDAAYTAQIAAQLGAFELPEGSKDAAFVVTLPPGAYTIQAAGVDGATGTALVEVYALE